VLRINVSITDDLNISFQEFFSIQLINPSGIVLSIAILFHSFLIVMFIEGSEYKATVLPPLLREISLITKSKACETHIIQVTHISTYKKSLNVFFILIFVFKE